MALVDLTAALPRPAPPDDPTYDPRLLAAAAGPGRIRGIALDVYATATAHPGQADGRVRRALREARALHSRERRLVADGIADLFRFQGVLDALLGPDPLARWLGWLVLRGLGPEAAAAAHPGPPYAAVAALPGSGRALGPAAVANVSEAAAAALVTSLGDDTAAFLAASNTRAATTLRVARHAGVEAVLAALTASGVAARRGTLAPNAIVVDGHPDLRVLASFREGAFEVQDEASQLVAEAVGAEGRVLDLCAGAGGKALALADVPGVEVVATDVRDRALNELARRADRAGVRVRTERIPETGPLPARLAADRVLVDAPCSGSGVLRRHPAYRLRWTPEHLDALTALQRDLLARAAPLVRPGGRLVYATCSVFRRENDDVVAAFLADHPGWRLADDAAPTVVADGPFLRTRPDVHGTDAFFAAVLRPPRS